MEKMNIYDYPEYFQLEAADKYRENWHETGGSPVEFDDSEGLESEMIHDKAAAILVLMHELYQDAARFYAEKQKQREEKVEVRVDIQGAVGVNCDCTHCAYKSEGAALFYVDLKAKRASVSATTKWEGCPAVVIVKTEETLYADSESKRMTLVSFPEFRGWDLFLCEISKYTLSVTLRNPKFGTRMPRSDAKHGTEQNKQ